MLSDNEIKKAWECCISTTGNCEKCPHSIDGKICSPNEWVELIKLTFDLINRKDAEIEKLNVELVGMRGACESHKMHYDNAQAEIERLKNSFDAQASLIEKKNLAYDRICVKHRNEIKAAKTEAIKEFAEKYEKAVLSLLTSATLDKKDGIHACLDILQEMVVDDNV